MAQQDISFNLFSPIDQPWAEKVECRPFSSTEAKVEASKVSVFGSDSHIKTDLGHGPILVNRRQFLSFLDRHPEFHEFRNLPPEMAIKAVWNKMLLKHTAWNFIKTKSGDEPANSNIFSFIKAQLASGAKFSSSKADPTYPFTIMWMFLTEGEAVSLPSNERVDIFSKRLETFLTESRTTVAALGLNNSAIRAKIVQDAKEFLERQEPLPFQTSAWLAVEQLSQKKPQAVNLFSCISQNLSSFPQDSTKRGQSNYPLVTLHNLMQELIVSSPPDKLPKTIEDKLQKLETEDHALASAFNLEHPMARNKITKDAISFFEQKVCDHQRDVCKQQLTTLANNAVDSTVVQKWVETRLVNLEGKDLQYYETLFKEIGQQKAMLDQARQMLSYSKKLAVEWTAFVQRKLHSLNMTDTKDLILQRLKNFEERIANSNNLEEAAAAGQELRGFLGAQNIENKIDQLINAIKACGVCKQRLTALAKDATNSIVVSKWVETQLVNLEGKDLKYYETLSREITRQKTGLDQARLTISAMKEAAEECTTLVQRNLLIDPPEAKDLLLQKLKNFEEQLANSNNLEKQIDIAEELNDYLKTNSTTVVLDQIAKTAKMCDICKKQLTALATAAVGSTAVSKWVKTKLATLEGENVQFYEALFSQIQKQKETFKKNQQSISTMKKAASEWRIFVEEKLKLVTLSDTKDLILQKLKNFEMRVANPNNFDDAVAAAEELHKYLETKSTRIVLEQIIESARIEEIELASPDTGKYDKQVIIDFGSGTTATGLLAKTLKKKPILETSIVQSNEAINALADKVQDLTLSSRMYVIGHSSPGSDTLSNDSGQQITIPMITDALKKNERLKKPNSGCLKISLVACRCAEGDSSGSPSFAEKLSIALDKEGIQAEVIGFVTGLQRETPPQKGLPPQKEYHKIATGHTKSKEPHTKLSFITDNGVTTKKMLY